MRIDLDTSKTTPLEAQALAAMFSILANGGSVDKPKPNLPPAGLDIHSSHEPIDATPTAVTVWTSKDGGEYVKDYINTADMAEIAETKTVEPKPKTDVKAVKAKLAEIKKTEAAKAAKAEKKAVLDTKKKSVAVTKPILEAAANPKPDARATVEAVVGVKPEAPAEQSPRVTTQLQGEIRKLNLQCAKYGKAEEAKAAVRDAVGGPCKLSEIPADKATGIITALAEIAKGAEDNG